MTKIVITNVLITVVLLMGSFAVFVNIVSPAVGAGVWVGITIAMLVKLTSDLMKAASDIAKD